MIDKQIEKFEVFWHEIPGRAETYITHHTVRKGKVTVAYARVTHEPTSSYGVISEIYVAPRFREMKIGDFLLKECEETINNEYGRPEAYLWVEKGSLPEKWYLSRGYQFHSEYNEESLPNHVWLKKQLV